jgi:phage terminase Nu1 subunit (DNA packaging protein)
MPVNLDSLTLSEVSLLLGVSERMVRNYIKDNGLQCVGDGKARRFVGREVVAWFGSYRVEMDGNGGNGAPSVSSSEPETIDDATLRKTKAEADLKELQLARERGQVGSIANMEKRLTSANKVTQTQILAVPSRLAGRLLGLSDYSRAVAILEAEMRQLLSNLATIESLREASGVEEETD